MTSRKGIHAADAIAADEKRRRNLVDDEIIFEPQTLKQSEKMKIRASIVKAT